MSHYVVLSCVGRGLCDGLFTRPEKASSSFPVVPKWDIGPSQILANGLHFLPFVSPLSKTHYALVVLLRLVLFQVTLGICFLRFPCGFQSSPCLGMLFWSFLKVCPIQKGPYVPVENDRETNEWMIYYTKTRKISNVPIVSTYSDYTALYIYTKC
jgi:hypothetical protein